MLSLIIPSFNPSLKLPETLDSLVVQRKLIDELIVVIDHSNFEKIPQALIEKYKAIFNLKLINQSDSGRGKSRNSGAEASTGDMLFFLDDDMIAEKELLEKHLARHAENSGIIVSGSGYRNPENARYDFGRFLIQMENGWKKTSNMAGRVTLENFNFTACNMSIPKKLFHQLNGFDTRFSDGEDFDFAVRAIKSDIEIQYDSSLLAWHNDWPIVETYIKRHNEYTAAKKEIMRIHPNYLDDFPNMEIKKASGIKKSMSLLFRILPGRLFFSENVILNSLPLKLKFLFYRIAIFAYSNDNR